MADVMKEKIVMYDIRTSTKAIIIKKSKILLLKMKDENGIWYSLPGGGQDYGETLHDCLKREVLEETSYNISVGDLLFVRDYIEENHEFAGRNGRFHQVELYFRAEEMGKKVTNNIHDNMQIGTEWLDVNELPKVNLYPKVFKKLISEIGKKELPIYLGDVN